jgi:hypothetical protein
MDWLIWLIVIVVIVAVVWWLLNRNSRSAAGSSEAGTVTGSGASPTAPPGGERHDGALSGGSAAASAVAAGTTGIPSAAGFGNAEPVAPRTAQEEPAAAQEQAEWETQWSETPPAEPHAAVRHEPSSGASAVQEDRTTPAGADAAGAANAPVHHPEYTQSHAPTLPGAESAAAEASLLEEQDTPSDVFASHRAEPAGHLALDQPYGEGSAAPRADGSAPEGFTVKGDASSMTYHDESSPSYGETAAGVWFESVAHAEAAGFRPPRRVRL